MFLHRFLLIELNQTIQELLKARTDVQYDLKNSKIIAFKTVKLEILEATNEYITYKVLSHFDGVM